MSCITTFDCLDRMETKTLKERKQTSENVDVQQEIYVTFLDAIDISRILM